MSSIVCFPTRNQSDASSLWFFIGRRRRTKNDVNVDFLLRNDFIVSRSRKRNEHERDVLFFDWSLLDQLDENVESSLKKIQEKQKVSVSRFEQFFLLFDRRVAFWKTKQRNERDPPFRWIFFLSISLKKEMRFVVENKRKFSFVSKIVFARRSSRIECGEFYFR